MQHRRAALLLVALGPLGGCLLSTESAWTTPPYAFDSDARDTGWFHTGDTFSGFASTATDAPYIRPATNTPAPPAAGWTPTISWRAFFPSMPPAVVTATPTPASDQPVISSAISALAPPE